MATLKQTKPIRTKAEQDELEIKGKGVERVVIPEVEVHAQAYVNLRDERMELLEAEVAAKKSLREMMHANEEKIGKDKDGSMIYRFGDQMIILRPGKEEVKVKTIPGGEPQNSREESSESSNGSE